MSEAGDRNAGIGFLVGGLLLFFASIYAAAVACPSGGPSTCAANYGAPLPEIFLWCGAAMMLLGGLLLYEGRAYRRRRVGKPPVP